MSEQVSFLRLPPELRLHVYSYLFTPYLTEADAVEMSEEKGSSLRGAHACMVVIDKNNSERCKRAHKHMHPQSLAVKKEIFAEAMPIWYSNLELMVFETSIHGPNIIVEHALELVPGYAITHIAKVSLHIHFASLLYWGKKWSLESYATALESKLPRLSHIRFEVLGPCHVDDGSFEYYLDLRTGEHYFAETDQDPLYQLVQGAFLPIASISGLQSVSVHSKVDWTGWSPTKAIMDGIGLGAKSQGKQVVEFEADNFGRKKRTLMEN